MDSKTNFVVGLGGSAVAEIVWQAIPAHSQFKISLQPETSPLAFIEHYHVGLGSILASKFTEKYSKVLQGFGAGFIILEAMQQQPFGYGKSAEQVIGNLTLTGILGLLILAI